MRYFTFDCIKKNKMHLSAWLHQDQLWELKRSPDPLSAIKREEGNGKKEMKWIERLELNVWES